MQAMTSGWINAIAHAGARPHVGTCQLEDDAAGTTFFAGRTSLRGDGSAPDLWRRRGFVGLSTGVQPAGAHHPRRRLGGAVWGSTRSGADPWDTWDPAGRLATCSPPGTVAAISEDGHASLPSSPWHPASATTVIPATIEAVKEPRFVGTYLPWARMTRGLTEVPGSSLCGRAPRSIHGVSPQRLLPPRIEARSQCTGSELTAAEAAVDTRLSAGYAPCWGFDGLAW
jgi:hypothetical protein